MNKKNKSFLSNYNRYIDKIFNYVWYRVGFNNSLAEDLCSEIFLKAFKNYDKFDQDRSFQAWIYRIAKNHLSNHYRCSGRETDLSQALDFSVESLEKINTNIETEKVLVCLEDLDAYSKEIIVMKYIDELDYKEMADILDKDVNALRVQASRALAKLKEKLNE